MPLDAGWWRSVYVWKCIKIFDIDKYNVSCLCKFSIVDWKFSVDDLIIVLKAVLWIISSAMLLNVCWAG